LLSDPIIVRRLVLENRSGWNFCLITTAWRLLKSWSRWREPNKSRKRVYGYFMKVGRHNMTYSSCLSG
jgi:hypothetical protein